MDAARSQSVFCSAKHSRTIAFIFLVAAYLGAAASALADQSERTWTFDLATPGSYKVQVEHRAKGADRSGTKVHYTIQAGMQSQSRDLDVLTDHPFIPLIVDLPHPTKMRVTVSGLSATALRATRVFVYDTNSQAPGEYFDPAKSIELPTVRQVRAMLKESEATLDLARAKITLDRMVDPSINLEVTLQQVDSIVARIRSMPEFGNADETKLEALRRYLYDAGEWNEHRAYQYDLNDPLGHKLSNKLLPTYLATRKGNCVTMPFLFIILGQRLGLPVTASTAPKHFLVKFQSEQYGWINLEATSGGKPSRDVWIRQQEPMTDEAVTNGVYLQPLTRRETAAEMATVVAERYLAGLAYEAAIAVADAILDTNPKDVGTMTLKAVAYGRLARSRFAAYASPDQIPAAQQGYFRYLTDRNREWFAKAEALGWREERPENEAQYQQRIEKAKQQGSSSN